MITHVILTTFLAFGFYYFMISVITSLVYYRTLVELPETYKALRDNRFVLQENFMGTMYFVHKDETREWCDRNTPQIIVFEGWGVALISNDRHSTKYLHSGILAYMNPVMAYWRIKFDRLFKHRGYDKV